MDLNWLKLQREAGLEFGFKKAERKAEGGILSRKSVRVKE